MKKIKKDYNSKILSLITISIFLLNNIAYGATLTNKSCLRVPVAKTQSSRIIETAALVENFFYKDLEDMEDFDEMFRGLLKRQADNGYCYEGYWDPELQVKDLYERYARGHAVKQLYDQNIGDEDKDAKVTEIKSLGMFKAIKTIWRSLRRIIFPGTKLKDSPGAINNGCPICISNMPPLAKGVRVEIENSTKFAAIANPFQISKNNINLVSLGHESQEITLDNIMFILNLTERCRSFRFGFNSKGAGASIPLHLHFQGIDEELPIESIDEIRLLTVDNLAISKLGPSWPNLVYVLRGDKKEIAKFIEEESKRNKAFNILFSRDKEGKLKVYFIPRSKEKSSNFSHGFGFGEMTGLILFEKTKDFNAAHPEAIKQALLECGYPQDNSENSDSLLRELALRAYGLPAGISKPEKIVLIQTKLATQKAKPTRFPAGILALASPLRNRYFLSTFFKKLNKKKFIFDTPDSYPGFNVKIIDLQIEDADFDLKKYLEEEKPDVVGVTSVTPAISNAIEIGSIIEQAVPFAVRVIGGVHASVLPEETLKGSNYHIVVEKEGIETFAELLMNLRIDIPAIESVDGIAYKTEDGCVKRTAPRVNIMRLDDYPSPAFSLDLIKVEGYQQIWNTGKPAGVLFTSTACPYNKCIFCASKAVFGYSVRLKSAQNIFGEIKYHYDRYGINIFFIEDDIFAIDKKRLEQLESLLESSGIKIQYFMRVRADYIDEEMADRLKATGCKEAAIGVESGDQSLLDNVIGKGVDLNKVIEATLILQSRGICVKYYMMVGLPDQSWESIRQSVYFLLKARPDEIGANVTMPYPGSDLYTDQRIRVVYRGDGVDKFIRFQQEAEPQLKSTEPIDATTETNTMSSEEITLARDLMLQVFQNRDNPIKLEPLLRQLDDLVENSKIEGDVIFRGDNKPTRLSL